MAELPCDVDGRCMVCCELPEESGLLSCNSCGSPWHFSCLAAPPTLPDTWLCPDCLPAPISEGNNAVAAPTTGDLVSKIRAIQEDSGLSEKEKARQRQDLLSRGLGGAAPPEEKNAKHAGARPGNTLDILADNLRCTMCLDLADRPVTTPCGHSSCLRCFKRYVMQGKKTCDKCRAPLPHKMISEPRINSALVIAIRLAKSGESAGERTVTKPSVAYLENEKRPDKAFRTERAVKPGKANACSGRVFVTVPPDHFGPILAEHVAEGGQVVYVGTSWEDRMECRQSGVHLPHVAGIAGQADYGAQSVALSGGYEDDEDHGDWFLYTGSGGRDLSGNKRTNKQHSFDQKFDKTNEALRLSCRQGYPVRVVRSHKEKRSSYAPENGVRYDGIYRIEKCWRKKGVQGFRVCRYLFVRCDNDPAPWTSDTHGDRPRPLPLVEELKGATDVSERKKEAFWEWNSETEVWGWAKAPPESQKEGIPARSEKRKRKDQIAEEKKVLKQFGCGLCHRILELPLSTPCGHNFCQSCLRDAFNSQEESRPQGSGKTRTLRERKPVRRCPTCKADISESYSNLQVNRHMESIIESVTKKMKAEQESNSTEEECMEETEV